jgi:hypothetical protein
LSFDPVDVDPISASDSLSLAVDVFISAVVVAHLYDLVDPAHLEGIEVDQLRAGIFTEDFFPELNSALQTRGHREQVFNARFALRVCISRRECQTKKAEWQEPSCSVFHRHLIPEHLFRNSHAMNL